MPITDLTGTKWVLTGFSYDAYNSDSWGFGVDFVSNNINFSSIGFDYSYMPPDPPYFDGDASGSLTYYGNNNSVTVSTIDLSSDGYAYVDSDYQTIEITGGTDATNQDLIDWLQANATQVIEPSASISIGNLSLAKSFIGNTEVSKIFLGDIKLYEKQTSATIQPPVISLYGIKENRALKIESQNDYEDEYEIYIDDILVGTYNKFYSFIVNNSGVITKCVGRQYYAGEIIVPQEIDGITITELGGELFADCVASKIVISEGVTTDSLNLFNENTETVNVVYPSTMTTIKSLFKYPFPIKIGYIGYIEYGYTDSIPASAFAFNKVITTATTFYLDIKSTITNIGNNAFNISTNYVSTYNMYFRQSANEMVTFGTTIIDTGTKKATKTYNIYTDNEGIKTTFESYAAQYTTINVYRLDGGAW